jgi:hypothetical protein
LPPARPKMHLRRGREGDVSKCRLALRSHFLPSGPAKMPLR